MGQDILAPAPGVERRRVSSTRHHVVIAGGGLNLLRCFAERGIGVTVADYDPDSLTSRSIYARATHRIASPNQDPEQTVADLVALGRTFTERPMLAFDNERILLLASRYRDELLEHYRFLLPDAELVEDLCCKLRFARLARRLSLPVPQSLVPAPGQEPDFDAIVQQVGLPCILKPTTHIGRFHHEVMTHEQDRACKVLRADTLADLKAKYGRMRQYCDAFLFQQYIPGGDDELYSFHAYVDERGVPLGFFVGRKIRTCPPDAGFSSYLELVYEPQVASLGLQCLQKMNHVGPMKLDFKRDPVQNRYYLLECNARFTLWNYLGAASGVNLPKLALASLHGEPVTPQVMYRRNVRWLSFGIDARAFLRAYRPDGTWTWGQWLRSLCSRKVYDVFAWRDPWPWVLCAGRFLNTNMRKLLRRLQRHQVRHSV